jgi:hypothetical protein
LQGWLGAKAGERHKLIRLVVAITYYSKLFFDNPLLYIKPITLINLDGLIMPARILYSQSGSGMPYPIRKTIKTLVSLCLLLKDFTLKSFPLKNIIHH